MCVQQHRKTARIRVSTTGKHAWSTLPEQSEANLDEAMLRHTFRQRVNAASLDAGEEERHEGKQVRRLPIACKVHECATCYSGWCVLRPCAFLLYVAKVVSNIVKINMWQKLRNDMRNEDSSSANIPRQDKRPQISDLQRVPQRYNREISSGSLADAVNSRALIRPE